MAKIRVTLDIEVEPYSDEELVAAGNLDIEDVQDCEPDEIDPMEIGEGIAGVFFEGSAATNEALAGTGIFVHIKGANLVGAVEIPAEQDAKS